MVAERATAAGDRVAELSARIEEGLFRLLLEPEGAAEHLVALVEAALPVFEDAGDDFALYTAYYALGMVAFQRARMDDALGAYEQALFHARRGGLPHHAARQRSSLAGSRFFGGTPVSELLAWLDEQEAAGVRDAFVRQFRANGLSMLGRFEEAREILSELRAELADRGATILLSSALTQGCELELLAGDPAAAVELGEEGCRLLEQAGERGWLSTTLGSLAQALYALDHFEETDRRAARAAELGASDDVVTQMLWRQVRAKVLARRGEHAEAERLAREAVAVGSETDIVNSQGDAHSDLAEVLELAGRREEAAAEVWKALALYERKGNLVMAERARVRLAELQPRGTRASQDGSN